MPRRFLLTLCVLAIAYGARGGEQISFHLEGDRLWLEAVDAPLVDVLQRFSAAGVRVQVDPALSGTITARLVDQDLERHLARLLDPHSYALFWESFEGPLGPSSRLAEIQVFRPGQRDRIEPLDGSTSRFSVAPWPGAPGIEYVRDEIVIGFSPQADQHALRILIRELGGTLIKALPDIGVYRLRLPPGTNIPALVAQLQRNPLVAAVEPNYAYRLPAPVTGTTTLATPARSTLAAVDGGAPIAILDSGVSDWPGLEGFVVGGFNALDPDAPPHDTGGHGTQMALIASGVVAPAGSGGLDQQGVPVLGIRTFDDQGVTSNFAVMDSVFHAVQSGARVVNMSWGSPARSTFLEQSVMQARQDGALVVAAVGNEPSGTPMYPAAFENVIGVAALEADGTPWSQSNYGDFVTVAAPGQAVLPVGHQGAAGRYHGTSIASAHVANALGHYFVQHPDATAADAEAALRTAVNPVAADPNQRTGHGPLSGDAWGRLLAP